MVKPQLSLLLIPLLSLSACIEPPEETEDEHLSNEIPYVSEIRPLETAHITIDGDNTDWGQVQNSFTDPTDDQNGNSATDIVRFSAAISGSDFALLLETSGSITMPHTPTADYSHYEVGLHLYEDGNCNSEELGFIIANNFTDSSGQNWHSLDNYIDSQATQSTTTFAYTGNSLETSFSLADLPVTARAVMFNPYIQSSGTPYLQHDNMNSMDGICFTLP